MRTSPLYPTRGRRHAAPTAEPVVRERGVDRYTVDNLSPSDALAATRPTLTVDLVDPLAPTVTDRLGQPVPPDSPRGSRAIAAIHHYRLLMGHGHAGGQGQQR
jgi:hypothetical protein